MSGTTEVEERIRSLNSTLASTLESHQKEGILLKTKIDEARSGETQSNAKIDTEVERAEERMDEIVDILITFTRWAWNEYKQIEAAFSAGTSRPASLDQAKELCQKSEDLMTSFLCYSLSYFRSKRKA